MTNYTDYNFYHNIYMGDMSETVFNEFITRASAEVRKNIFDRDITNYSNEVQMATCSVVDCMYAISNLETQKQNMISNNELKSESVGDYSKTYNSVSFSDIEKEIANQNLKISKNIRMYLIDTGLLYRGG